MDVRKFQQGRRCYGSAPTTRSNSPVHIHRGEPSNGRFAREEFIRVPPDEDEEGDQRRHVCLVREILHDVTFDCLLFVCITLLMVLAMTTMTVVVLLHAVSGGKLFARHDSRKNIIADEKPPYNFNP